VIHVTGLFINRKSFFRKALILLCLSFFLLFKPIKKWIKFPQKSDSSFQRQAIKSQKNTGKKSIKKLIENDISSLAEPENSNSNEPSPFADLELSRVDDFDNLKDFMERLQKQLKLLQQQEKIGPSKLRSADLSDEESSLKFELQAYTNKKNSLKDEIAALKREIFLIRFIEFDMIYLHKLPTLVRLDPSVIPLLEYLKQQVKITRNSINKKTSSFRNNEISDQDSNNEFEKNIRQTNYLLTEKILESTIIGLSIIFDHNKTHFDSFFDALKVYSENSKLFDGWFESLSPPVIIAFWYINANPDYHLFRQAPNAQRLKSHYEKNLNTRRSLEELVSAR